MNVLHSLAGQRSHRPEDLPGDARFAEYFLIETDKTAIGENVLHKAVGIILLAVILKGLKLAWSDIGFQRNGNRCHVLRLPPLAAASKSELFYQKPRVAPSWRFSRPDSHRLKSCMERYWISTERLHKQYFERSVIGKRLLCHFIWVGISGFNAARQSCTF